MKKKDIAAIIQLTHVEVTPAGRVETPFTEEEVKEWLKENSGFIKEGNEADENTVNQPESDPE